MSWIQMKKSLFQPCDPLKENHWIVEFLPTPGYEHYYPHPAENVWKYYHFKYEKISKRIVEIPIEQSFELAMKDLMRGQKSDRLKRHYRLRNIITNEIIPGELFV